MCSDAMIMCMIMALLTWALSFNTFFDALKTMATNFSFIHNLILGVFWIFTINMCTYANIIYLVKVIKSQNFKISKLLKKISHHEPILGRNYHLDLIDWIQTPNFLFDPLATMTKT